MLSFCHYFLLLIAINLINVIELNGVEIPCEDDTECLRLKGTDVKCVKEGNVAFCHCNNTKECPEDQITMVTKIGEKCKHYDECNINSSKCKDGKCVCTNGTVASTDAKQCIPVSSGIGGNCEDSVQCYSKISHSACTGNKCVCQNGMHEFNGSCHKDVELDQNCSSVAECSLTENSDCINNTCRCIEKYVRSPSTNKCLLQATKYGSPCIDDVQCVKLLGGASECSNGKCECRDLYQLKESTNKCVKDMLLGEICQVHKDCHDLEEGSRLICIEGECKCKPFYFEEHGYCVSSACPQHLAMLYLIIIVIRFMLF